MISVKKTYLFACVTSVFISGCCEHLPDRRLSDYEQSLLPYHVGQELIFKNQFAQIETLSVAEYEFENRIVKGDNNEWLPSRKFCYGYERIEGVLEQNIYDSLNILFAMSPKQDYSYPYNSTKLNFHAFRAHVENYHIEEWTMLDEFEVAGITYNEVLLADTSNAMYGAYPNSAVAFYFAPDVGLIRFDMFNGDVWELQE